jgi:hypothetical protein
LPIAGYCSVAAIRRRAPLLLPVVVDVMVAEMAVIRNEQQNIMKYY